ncbi:hypothetical protein Slu03_02270 [Sediminihabitans luteus]|nr:hypothetical protein Slu03_02270 [Sediminihabitans luteus]
MLLGVAVVVRVIGRSRAKVARFATAAILLAGLSAITIVSGAVVGAGSDGSVLSVVREGMPVDDGRLGGDGVTFDTAHAVYVSSRNQVIVAAALGAAAVVAVIAAVVLLVRGLKVSESPTGAPDLLSPESRAR